MAFRGTTQIPAPAQAAGPLAPGNGGTRRSLLKKVQERRSQGKLHEIQRQTGFQPAARPL